jgi:threonine dehydrogenase-like Zn-dependent dehydrogenase
MNTDADADAPDDNAQGAPAQDAPRALWHVAPGRSVIAPAALGEGAALVRMTHSALSRGTERLVRDGRVPPAERARMRGPAQEGEFPFPVKYGYCAVGVAEEGPKALVGRHVFALHPHQTRFRLDPEALFLLPPGLPPARATLLANMETAVNAIWDSGLAAGDRVGVIGAGVVGCLIARLAARHPGTRVVLSDMIDARAALASELGVTFALTGRDVATQAPAGHDAGAQAPAGHDAGAPPPAGGGAGAPPFDIVFECSATAGGMAAAIDMLGVEGALVSVGWHGAGTTALPLGGAFHSHRLRLISSQVARLPPGHAPRWDHRRRLALAADLLAADPCLDALIGDHVAFDALPDRLDDLLGPDAPGATSVIVYP